MLRAAYYFKQTLLCLLCLLILSPEFKRLCQDLHKSWRIHFIHSLWLTQVAVSNEIVQGGIYSSVTQTERGVLGGRTSSRQSGAGPGQTRGDKSRKGESARGTASSGESSPQGQKGGSGLLPWQIWRCPVLLFPLRSLFLQEATSRWAPKSWQTLDVRCAVCRCSSAVMYGPKSHMQRKWDAIEGPQVV